MATGVQRPHAGWKPQSLVGELARAGWGDLAGPDMRGATVVLTQLADVVDRRTGRGEVTLEELAARSQYTPKWVASRLRLLDDAGLVQYTPGGVEAGRPVPSAFRIVRSALVAALAIARKARKDVLAAHHQLVRDRIAAARLSWTRAKRPRGHNRRSRLWNSVPASPPPRGTPEGAAPRNHPPDPCEHGVDRRELTRDGTPRCALCRNQ